MQVPNKVKKLVLGWLSHIVFLQFHNEHQEMEGRQGKGDIKVTEKKETLKNKLKVSRNKNDMMHTFSS